ncbi:MAG: response regulator transcription factor [Verrucomicrobiia bacterium]
MIVDDHAEMRTFIRSLLTGLAQQFVECADGKEAVAAFPLERPDWTLMDIAMPGMDGLTATRRIKAQFPEARILVITQHDSHNLRASARDAGATGFLGKEELTRLESILTDFGPPQSTPGQASIGNP